MTEEPGSRGGVFACVDARLGGPNPRATVEGQRSRRAALFDGIGHRTIKPDPLRLHVLRLQQAHRPQGWLAARRRLAVGVPQTHLPTAAHPRFERLASVNHLRRLVGDDFAAIPEVALVVGQLFGRAGHENLIGGLLCAAPGVAHLPRQSRLDHVDAQWIDAVFATQVFRRGGALRSGSRRKCG